MRSVVVSDLHFGAASGADLLRRPEFRAPLVEFLRAGDRLVVLGDTLELRDGPVAAAADHALPFLREVGERLGAGGKVVLAGGNHDHQLIGTWAEAHPELGLEHRIDPADAGPVAQRLAAAARPAALTLAYPGLWLRDDVYALHGHYLDLHTPVPTIERLAAGLMARAVAPIPAPRAVPADYEAALAPLYAWMYALAQRSGPAVARAGARSSTRAYVAMAGAGRRARPVRARVYGAGLWAAVKAVNLAGVGPVEPGLSSAALRRGSLRGLGEALARLDVRAEHVLFGHTHRSGPWPADDPAEWVAPTGSRLVNTGSWVYQRHFLGGPPGESPYWPGVAVVVDEDGPPRLQALLRDASHAALSAGLA